MNSDTRATDEGVFAEWRWSGLNIFIWFETRFSNIHRVFRDVALLLNASNKLFTVLQWVIDDTEFRKKIYANCHFNREAFLITATLRACWFSFLVSDSSALNNISKLHCMNCATWNILPHILRTHWILEFGIGTKGRTRLHEYRFDRYIYVPNI